jgi:hypothetical protein
LQFFVDELAGAVGLLATAPEAGVPYRPRGAAGVRRLLPKTRYHIYNRYDREKQAQESARGAEGVQALRELDLVSMHTA